MNIVTHNFFEQSRAKKSTMTITVFLSEGARARVIDIQAFLETYRGKKISAQSEGNKVQVDMEVPLPTTSVGADNGAKAFAATVEKKFKLPRKSIAFQSSVGVGRRLRA